MALLNRSKAGIIPPVLATVGGALADLCGYSWAWRLIESVKLAHTRPRCLRRKPANVRFFNRAWESSSVYRLVGFIAAWVTLLSVVST
jgi:hypothetical protein